MESSRLTKSQIINQIATSILAQANASSKFFKAFKLISNKGFCNYKLWFQ